MGLRAPLLARLYMLAAASGAALAEPIFSPVATGACIDGASANSPEQSGHIVLDCVGQAAAACMMIPGCDTTIGMMACLEGELGYWDARLNAAYAGRVAKARGQSTGPGC
jgi:uncharacterized protein YecT (DUF1311 family)